MDWPATTPVVNPLDNNTYQISKLQALLFLTSFSHVWDILQRQVTARPAQQTWEDLEQAIIQKWTRIPRLAIRKLISTNFMCRVVIDAGGDQTQYLLNVVCDFQNVTLLFVKWHASPTNMQTFIFRQWLHLLIPHMFPYCYVLLHFNNTVLCSFLNKQFSM